MAEDDRRDDDREDDEEQAQKASAVRPWYQRWWVWLLLGLLVVGLGVGVTLFTLGASSPSELADAETADASSSQQSKAAAIYYPLNPEFITNYNVRGRQRYVKVDMTLMLRDTSVVPTLELHMPALRNAIIMLLRGQVYEELQTPEGKELLRQHTLAEVREVLQTEIGVPGVEQVLFTNFVMQ